MQRGCRQALHAARLLVGAMMQAIEYARYLDSGTEIACCKSGLVKELLRSSIEMLRAFPQRLRFTKPAALLIGALALTSQSQAALVDAFENGGFEGGSMDTNWWNSTVPPGWTAS